MAIAGCTLATGIAAGLADRKRPFSMLRLTGARLATVRRVVVLETAVPLIAVAIVAIGAALVLRTIQACPPRLVRVEQRLADVHQHIRVVLQELHL